MEYEGSVPPGTVGRGSFDIHGGSPINGPLRMDCGRSIYVVDRPFFGKGSRNGDRSLKADRVTRFEAYRGRHCRAA